MELCIQRAQQHRACSEKLHDSRVPTGGHEAPGNGNIDLVARRLLLVSALSGERGGGATVTRKRFEQPGYWLRRCPLLADCCPQLFPATA